MTGGAPLPAFEKLTGFVLFAPSEVIGALRGRIGRRA
jgi:hypothetical protein